jgi:SAM-dependent methyltransferase
MCKRYLASDTSTEIMAVMEGDTANLKVAVADAVDFDVPPGSFDVVLSCQLIEHLHPEDVPSHLTNVCRALRPGGRYMFDTPCGLTGPHDVSRFFDPVATGFHLKEWTHEEMAQQLGGAGFRRARSHILAARLSSRVGRLFVLGLWALGWKVAMERLFGRIPNRRLRRIMGKLLNFDNLWIVATK